MSAAVAGETALNEPTKLRALKVGCDELADIMEPSRPTMQRTRGSSQHEGGNEFLRVKLTFESTSCLSVVAMSQCWRFLGERVLIPRRRWILRVCVLVLDVGKPQHLI